MKKSIQQAQSDFEKNNADAARELRKEGDLRIQELKDIEAAKKKADGLDLREDVKENKDEKEVENVKDTKTSIVNPSESGMESVEVKDGSKAAPANEE